MLFMLLFYGDNEKMAEILRQDPAPLMAQHLAFNTQAQERSRLIEAHALQPVDATVTVLPQAGTSKVVAGATTENRLSLNGFYLINCKDLDEAVDIAKLYPMPEDMGHVEVRPTVQEWKTAPIADSAAPAAAIWSLYSDVSSWPDWMDGVAAMRLDGAFAAGTAGEITMTDGAVRPLRLATVSEPESFTMEIRLPDGTWLWVGHYLKSLPDGGTRVTHEPLVPHTALEVLGLNFSRDVNAQARASVENLAKMAAVPRYSTVE